MYTNIVNIIILERTEYFIQGGSQMNKIILASNNPNKLREMKEKLNLRCLT